MRKQLRSFHPPDTLDEIYSRTYNHELWGDHIERVQHTVNLLDQFARVTDSRTVADLSCGDGAILNKSTHLWEKTILGDYTSTGPIELALGQIEPVDMFILSETLEHLEDPDFVLHAIREKAKYLILTTPLNETSDENIEHYWGWDVEGIREMLSDSGWTHDTYSLFTAKCDQYYTFQMWMCE